MKSSLRLSKRFEYLLAAVLIGAIVLVAVDRYLFLGRETQRLGFELLANNFVAGAANVQVHWLISRREAPGRDWVEIDGEPLYINSSGWPRGSQPLSAPLKVEDCAFLWQKLLQNPPILGLDTGTTESRKTDSVRYQAGLRFGEVCRYQMLIGEREIYAFDYATRSGQLKLDLPENDGSLEP
jgi:hypothetical protein